MALNPKTQQALMDMLKVKQPQSIAAPLSPYEAIQMERGLLSTDPVVSKLQKVGRGVKSLLEPETPMDYLNYLIAGGVIKGSKIAGNVVKEISEKANVPKTVFHGSSPRQEKIKNITSTNYRMAKPNERLQSAIFTTADKGLARKYGSYDDNNIYEIDLSDVSKLKNLLSIGKNQVLNTSKPQEKIVANLNKKIKELSVGNNSNKLKSKLLKDFRKQLGKENYVSKVGPTVKEFLLENNVKLLRTNPEEYLMKNVPSQLSKSNLKDTYILLEDAVPVK